MHGRTFFILTAFGTASLLAAQTTSVTPSPNWRLGDERQVDLWVETKITLDTLVMNMKGASTYYLEVTSARKDGYELNVRCAAMDMPTLDMDIGTGGSALMDSVNTVISTIINAVHEPFSNWEIRYRLDRSGKVLGRIENQHEKGKVKSAMQEAMRNAFAGLSKMTGEATVEIPNERIEHLVDSLYGAFLEVQVNEMSYFLKIYKTDFPLTGSLRQPVMVTDVQAPLHPDIPALPAILEAGLDKNDKDELVGRTITTYDPDALFEAMKDSAGTFQRKGLFMEEESVEHFDKRTGWLTHSTSVIIFRAGAVKMDMRTKTRLNVIE